MPSPVGHSLVGYLIYELTLGSAQRPQWPIVVLYLVVANAPDLDFVPGLLVGEVGRYHHGITHSIGFAAVVGFAFSFGLYLYKGAVIWRNFLILFSLYFSHVVLDYLSMDTSLPRGVPIYWPLGSEYHIAPFALFSDITRVSSSSAGFISSLFSLHNLWSMCVEFLVFFPFALLLFTRRRRLENWSE